MRDDLITMLDYFEVNALLGIRSCATLFSVDAGLVHYTSALRYPVFVEGDNYSGQPSMTRHPLLRDQLLKHFTAEARALPDALFVPLGAKVAEALEFVARNGALDRERILDGLQHPSPANRERVAYLLGRKLRAELSVKTNADIVDRARNLLQAKIARLRGKC
jgi:hypothetical protein